MAVRSQYLSLNAATRTRIRACVKRGGLSLALILIGLLVHSCWTTVGLALPNGFSFGVEGGALGIAAGSLPQGLSPPPPGPIYIQKDAMLHWWFSWGTYSMRWYFTVPLWNPIIISASSAAWAWRKEVLERRRNSVGLCRKCGYDRNGLEVIAKCPERGSRTRSPLSNRSHRFVFHEKSITSVVSLDRFI